MILLSATQFPNRVDFRFLLRRSALHQSILSATGVILGLTDMLAPRCSLAFLVRLRQCEMNKQLVGCGAVPVHRIGWDLNHVAWLEHLCRLPVEADAAGPAHAVKGLPQRMRVRGSARARGKGVNQTGEARRQVGRSEQFLEYDASEGL